MAMDKPWYDGWLDDDGTGLTGTIWNKAELLKLINGVDASQHVCIFYAPVDVAIAVGWSTPNLYGVEVMVPATGWGAATANPVIPPNGGGLYYLFASIVFSNVAPLGALRAAVIQRGGVAITPTFYQSAVVTGGGGASIQISTITNLFAGHDVAIAVYTDVATQVTAQSRFGLCRL
jgi:hypothetical protein